MTFGTLFEKANKPNKPSNSKGVLVKTSEIREAEEALQSLRDCLALLEARIIALNKEEPSAAKGEELSREFSLRKEQLVEHIDALEKYLSSVGNDAALNRNTRR